MENVIEFDKIANEPLSDQDMVNLFMGLFRLVRRQYQSQIDRLHKQIEELESRLKKQPKLRHAAPQPSKALSRTR